MLFQLSNYFIGKDNVYYLINEVQLNFCVGFFFISSSFTASNSYYSRFVESLILRLDGFAVWATASKS